MPHQPTHSVADSLKDLATHRGNLLTEEQYRSFRSSLLNQLVKPRKSEWLLIVPALIGVFAGQIGVFVGVAHWKADIEAATIWFIAGFTVGSLTTYLAMSKFPRDRAEMRRSPSTRLAELEELLAAKLIEQEEYEQIKAKIENSIT